MFEFGYRHTLFHAGGKPFEAIPNGCARRKILNSYYLGCLAQQSLLSTTRTTNLELRYGVIFEKKKKKSKAL